MEQPNSEQAKRGFGLARTGLAWFGGACGEFGCRVAFLQAGCLAYSVNDLPQKSSGLRSRGRCELARGTFAPPKSGAAHGALRRHSPPPKN